MTTATKPKRPQAKRRSRRDYADRLWRQYIRARDVTCQMASSTCWGDLQAAHFHRRGIFSTRWEADNGALLCELHHGEFDRNEAFKWEWIRERLGPKRYEALKRLVAVDWDRDYDAVLARIKALEVP